MESVSESVSLKLRVIVVTTRAALRHAADDPDQRRQIMGRGRALIEGVPADSAMEADDVAQALAELDRMSAG